MDLPTMVHWIAAAAFAVGTVLAVLVRQSVNDERVKSQMTYLAVIPGFAGAAYVGIALGIGTVTINGTQLVGLRYVDWLVTTPLLVGYVGYVAGASRRTIAGVMLADALMILAGVGAVVTIGVDKWGLFGVSSLFHVTLFGYLYVVFPRQISDDPQQIGLFSLLKNHIGLLWLAYPFVWLMGPAGIGYTLLAGTDLTFAFLDVMAKVPYVYFFYARQSVFTDGALQQSRERQAATAD